jgi:hypothetical protein
MRPSPLPVFNVEYEMMAMLTENTVCLRDRTEEPISGASGNKAQTGKLCVCVKGGEWG